jgi:D-glycero-D-manno-heptose 1,7-bisphosphate phosphatase
LNPSDKSSLKPSRPRPAVFLDRDGTICEEMGYLNHISRLHIYPHAAVAIRRLNDAGVPVIVVTNQSGVSRGFFPESLVQEVHQKIMDCLAASGAHLDGFYYCTHTRTDECNCRKPLPGLLERAAREHGIDLGRSFVVGDRYVDVELAHAAGGRGVLVLTGYGSGDYQYHRHQWPRQPDWVLRDLDEAVTVILKELR